MPDTPRNNQETNKQNQSNMNQGGKNKRPEQGSTQQKNYDQDLKDRSSGFNRDSQQ